MELDQIAKINKNTFSNYLKNSQIIKSCKWKTQTTAREKKI